MIKKIIGLFFLLFCLWAFLTVFFPKKLETTSFSVKKGEALSEIASNLEGKGLVRSENIFQVWALINGKQKSILAGDYDFPSSLSLYRALKILTINTENKVKITIIEGWSLRDIGSHFETLRMFQAEELFAISGIPAVDYSNVLGPLPFDFSSRFDFLEQKPKNISLEGYLFPDTYDFGGGCTMEEIVETMLENFDEKTKDLRGENFFETIIMASLLEKEVKTFDEKKIVAGILWKRLRNGWPLQVDATLTYLTGKKSSEITGRDKELDSLYNTYKYRGLPLGPICNPGIESIRAALNYEETPYWFYLTTKQGKAVYARTLEEHNQNKYKYLQ